MHATETPPEVIRSLFRRVCNSWSSIIPRVRNQHCVTAAACEGYDQDQVPVSIQSIVLLSEVVLPSSGSSVCCVFIRNAILKDLEKEESKSWEVGLIHVKRASRYFLPALSSSHFYLPKCDERQARCRNEVSIPRCFNMQRKQEGHTRAILGEHRRRLTRRTDVDRGDGLDGHILSSFSWVSYCWLQREL